MTPTKAKTKIRIDLQTMSLGQMADAGDMWDDYPKNKGRGLMDAMAAGDFRAIAHLVSVATGMTVDAALELSMDDIDMVGAAGPESLSGGSGVKRAPSRANGR